MLSASFIVAETESFSLGENNPTRINVNKAKMKLKKGPAKITNAFSKAGLLASTYFFSSVVNLL